MMPCGHRAQRCYSLSQAVNFSPKFDLPWRLPKGFVLSEKLDPRRILSLPVAYRIFSSAIARKGWRALHVRENIRAAAGDRILDIGCGPGDVLDYLPEVDYHGFDLNEAYIEFAKIKYRGRGQFHCRSVEKAVLPGDPHSYDIVTANAILHHLPDGEAATLFQLAHHALKPGGRLVTFDGCYVQNQNKIARYLLSHDRGKYVRTTEGYLALAKETFATVDHKIYENLLRLPYTHIVLECIA
jgi:2-polyprenyl-3-methyl-5-hydroxy-6-metoxy-1,4-benzoquinol methylase